MKILITPTSIKRKEGEKALGKLKEFADELVYNPFGRPLTSDEVIKLTDGCDGYLAGLDYIDEKAVNNMPKSMKVISRYGVGTDRIDMEAARVRGIIVTNTPNANTQSVAELTVALILCAARHISKMDASMHSGKWERGKGTELFGKTLGLLGLGNIGKSVTQIVQGFSMKIICYDPYVAQGEFKNYNVEKAEIGEVFRRSDILSLHLPLNEETCNILNKETFKLLKPGCILVNTARGGLINEFDALSALKEGRLKALALDVFEQEPPNDHPLYSHENVLLTPHIGAHTSEAVEKMSEMSVNNLINVLKGA